MSLVNNEETTQINMSVDLSDSNSNDATFIKKDKWANDAEFLLSCISLSVIL